MTLDNILGDNPSVEVQVAIIVTSLAKHIEKQHEVSAHLEELLNNNTDKVDRLVLLQREQNSNVANITEKQNETNLWIAKHDDWHGKEDKKIADRVSHLKGRNEVLLAEWKIVLVVLSSGGLGAVIGKLGNLLGWW